MLFRSAVDLVIEILCDFGENQSDLYTLILTGIPAGTPAGTPAAYRLRTDVAERVLNMVVKTWNLMGKCVKINKGQNPTDSSG